MARITYIPDRVIDSDGISDGASLFVYQAGSTTPVSLYLDPDYLVPTTNPYVVAAGAAVPPLYHNFSGNVRLKVTTSAGTVRDEDPYGYLTFGATTDISVADRVALAALVAPVNTQRAYVLESGRQGVFIFSTADLSAEVATDPEQGVYVAPASDTTGASGAWVRQFTGGASLKWFGAVGDGVTDDKDALQAWLNFVGATGVEGYVPPGRYSLDTSAGAITYTASGNVSFAGAGSAVSVFVRADNVLPGSTYFQRMLEIKAADGADAEVSISGLGFDGNARGQPVPSPDTEFQQAHCLMIQPLGIRAWRSVHLDDISIYDAIGDGIGLNGTAGQSFGSINLSNIHESERLYTRSGLTITAGWDRLNVSNINVVSVQIENNGIESGHLYHVNGSNWNVQEVDFNLKNAKAAGVRAPCNITGLNVSGYANLLSFDFNVDNFDIKTDFFIRLLWGDYRFSNGNIHANAAFAPDSTNNALIENIADSARSATFRGVTFTADAGVTNIDQVYLDANLTPTDTKGIHFHNCRFSITRAYSAKLRSGQYTFDDCTHEYDGTTQTSPGAIFYGGAWNAAGVTNRMRLTNNRLTTATAYLWTPPISGNAVSIESSNPMIPGRSINFERYDHIAAPHGPGAIWQFKRTDEWFETADLVLTSNLPTTGKWVKGMKVYYADPGTTGCVGLVCTTSGNGDGTAATGAATGAAWRKYAPTILTGSKTHDWPDLATATTQNTTVTVTGAALGDKVDVSMNVVLSGTHIWGEVTAANTVTVYHRNDTGGNVNVASGTLAATVTKA